MGTKHLAVAALCCLAGRADPSYATELNARLRNLEGEFRNLQGVLRIPGMSIAVAKDDVVIWTQAFGWADVENRVRATPDTLYPIGSLTKPMAATLALRLLEERRLGLDDPLSKYHKDFQTDRVRVRHILTHTAGIAPGGRSGDRYEYSGSWFGYLAAVIEKAGGESYREQFETRILEPLGMTDSIPGMDLLESTAKPAWLSSELLERYREVSRRLAKPYALKGGRIVLTQYPPTFFGSSAGLVSTVKDLAKFDAAINRNQLIERQTQELAWTNAVTNSGRPIPYGLGWFVQEIVGHRIVWHYGQWPMFTGLIVKVPDLHITLIILANSNGLNAPFRLAEDGDVQTSAFALSFLRTFIQRDSSHGIPAPDWRLDGSRFQARSARLTSKYRYDFRDEVKAHAAIQAYLEKASRL